MRLARLVAGILDVLFPPADTAHIVRACTEEEFYSLVSTRRNEQDVVALLPYRQRLVRAAVIEAKFRKNTRAIALLAGALRDYLAARIEESAGFGHARFVMVPIPLSRERFYGRGYNQIEEVVEAAHAPFASLLERTRDTKPQTSLSRRERLSNMEGAFRATSVLDSAPIYIVLDDVTTTGATLSAAADALRAAGAERIELLALAH